MAYTEDKEPDALTALSSLENGDVIVVGDISDASEPAKHITKANFKTDIFNSPTLVTPVLGVATATSVNGLTVDTTTGTLDVANGATLTVNGSATITNGTHSGTNTGDQTNITGNAATVTVADAANDTTTFPLLGTAATGSLTPATDSSLTYNASTGTLTASDVVVDDEAYGVGWNGSLEVPTKNAVYDKIETVSAGSGTGIEWSEVTGTSQAAAVNNGYIANNAGLVTVTLPDTAAVGDMLRVVGKGAGLFKIGQNASEIIHFGNLDTTTGTGGSVTATHRRDAIELVCVVANLEWSVMSAQGNFTIV